MGRLGRIIILIIVFIGFAAVVGAGFLYILCGGDMVDCVQSALIRFSLASRDDDLNRPVSSDTTAVRFTVESGDTPPVIAGRLYEANLILDADLFVDYVRAERLDVQLEAGTYFLNKAQTIPQIALALTDSRNSSITFTILEGWRIEEVAAAIDQNPLFGFSGADFVAIVTRGAEMDSTFASYVVLPPGASLEGFLYPNTYQLPPEITPLQLRTLLTQTFRDTIGTQLIQDATTSGYTLYQIVTLASIVEREALHNDEHPLIASVYLNRLEIGMKLDADPTVQYGLQGLRGTWWPQITPADYQGVVSDYNTYLSFGLPPGPISNPSLSAIRAAVYPAESSYFFFRAACDGSGYHQFAITFEEHINNGC